MCFVKRCTCFKLKLKAKAHKILSFEKFQKAARFEENFMEIGYHLKDVLTS